MAIRLVEKYSNSFIGTDEYKGIQGEVSAAHRLLCDKSGAGSDYLGWVTLPEDYDKEEFARIKAAAEKIKKTSSVFIVVGIGGSYLGARAVIEFLKSPLYNSLPNDTPDIYFAGNCISAVSMAEIAQLCKDRDVCINVISKSGTTTEPAVAFRVLRGILEEKYGVEGARERIFVTTDKAK